MSKTPPHPPAEDSLIPASPSEDDYVAQVTQAEPPPLLSEEDPFALFAEWLREAGAKEPNDPNAMALATADADGAPDVRMVLLKDVDPDGFVFYTNLESAKGRQLADNPRAALLFHWKSLRRQVRVRGSVAPVTAAEADAYFATRARASQLGAWASSQSRPLPDRLALEKRIAETGLRFGLGKVERPPHWSGFRLTPTVIEFWRDRPFRLHERLVFARASGGWTTERLYP
ncbi:pyridoxamine 5'-phosphate oxidase [Phenylobacterium sp.]|uniref:pyridoxamine 5'-phosphate oxidase n=1 Tax=Phenylobacterium sp. TaxID=1871053 RepID=UPI00260CAF89|nr:pyridoxamine 5'-phosphate oxidase [Phenylobacterium sp.]